MGINSGFKGQWVRSLTIVLTLFQWKCDLKAASKKRLRYGSFPKISLLDSKRATGEYKQGENHRSFPKTSVGS